MLSSIMQELKTNFVSTHLNVDLDVTENRCFRSIWPSFSMQEWLVDRGEKCEWKF